MSKTTHKAKKTHIFVRYYKIVKPENQAFSVLESSKVESCAATLLPHVVLVRLADCCVPGIIFEIFWNILTYLKYFEIFEIFWNIWKIWNSIWNCPTDMIIIWQTAVYLWLISLTMSTFVINSQSHGHDWALLVT